MVFSFSGFLRSTEFHELRRNNITHKKDHIEINKSKNKTDQLTEGKTPVISET